MVENFVRQYLNKIKNHISLIDDEVIFNIITKFNYVNDNNYNIFIVGNGGSAATASHMQNDLGSGLKRRGILNLNIISLCDNISVLTALANDIGYENIFFSQIEDRITSKDLLIAISCSGNSTNIIKAVEYTKRLGATVIGMTGFDGGQLKKLSDISYHVQTEENEYGVVEDLHMILDHMLYTYYIERGKNDG